MNWNLTTVRALAAFSAILVIGAAFGAETSSRDVQFKGAGDFELRGTLLIPESREGGKLPAVLLLPGSGPTDRNGNQPPLLIADLLKQISEHLSKQGFVTMRFDKRAAHTYASAWPTDMEKVNEFFSYENFMSDVKSAFAFLAQQPEVDPNRVAIFGHSEGGLFALQAAHDLKDAEVKPAGLILAATAGRTLDVVLVEQVTALLQRQTTDGKVRADLLQQVHRAIEQVKRDKTVPGDLHPGLVALFNPAASKLLHAYFTVDPAQLAKSAAGPVLIIQGDMDSQISHLRDAPALQKALTARDSRDSCQLTIVAGASHNFKAVENPREPGFTGPVKPEVLNTITDWAAAHLKQKPAAAQE